MSIATVKRFTIDDYHRLTDLGFFAEDDRIELIHGQFIEIVAKGTAHEVCITNLIPELVRILGDRATIRVQSPIILPPDSEPEPDFTIAVNKSDDKTFEILSQFKKDHSFRNNFCV